MWRWRWRRRWRSAKSFGAKDEEERPVVVWIMILSPDDDDNNNPLDIRFYSSSCGSEIRNEEKQEGPK
jgi:hypothetical protein